MKLKKTMTSVAFLLLGLGGLHAQESLTATGGRQQEQAEPPATR